MPWLSMTLCSAYISAADRSMERVKAQYETRFYGGLSSVLGKAFQLAQYNIFAPTPGYFAEDLERTLASSCVQRTTCLSHAADCLRKSGAGLPSLRAPRWQVWPP